MPGHYVELFVDQGANFSSEVTITNSTTNAAINIASYSFSGRIKSSHFSANVTEIFICTITDAANGLLTISLPSANTANIEQGRYVYKLNMTGPSSETTPVIEGPVIVLPDV